jgi:hypothetical protein
MKNLFLFTLAITSLGLGSCSKCKICTKDKSPEVRICEGDYSSTTSYGVAVDFQEAQGYKCKASI